MIHVVFSSSAAGTLRQALRERAQKARVVELSANLEWGPITDGTFKSREEWFDAQLPPERVERGWDWLSHHAERFSNEIMADADRLVWLSPRSAAEQAGFFWYLQRFGDNETRILIADYILRVGAPRHEAPLGLGEVNVAAMIELLDEAPRSDWNMERFPKDKWLDLMREDSILRIVDNNILTSVGSDYFDFSLLERCTTEWTRFYYIIGNTMADLSDAGHSVGDDFLFWRMRELSKSGKIECASNFPRWGAKFSDAPMVRRVV
ncbi:MAG: DUF3658 domain-containing protein [Sphingomonas sp.]